MSSERGWGQGGPAGPGGGPETGGVVVPVAQRPDPATLSFEQARTELDQIVAQLERGQVPLEEALALWERGDALGQVCRQWLANARERVNARTSAAAAGSDGTPF